MEELQKTVSDKHSGKTHLCADLMLRRSFWGVRKIFVGTQYVELDRVCARKCNAERVIVFQSVILQRAQCDNNSPQIRKCVLF